MSGQQEHQRQEPTTLDTKIQGFNGATDGLNQDPPGGNHGLVRSRAYLFLVLEPVVSKNLPHRNKSKQAFPDHVW